MAGLALHGCDPYPTTPAVADEASTNNVWQKAKLRGVSFRAIGQEPGWLLEITNGKEILLVTDYGQNRVSLPYVEPVVDQAARRTERDGKGVTIREKTRLSVTIVSVRGRGGYV